MPSAIAQTEVVQTGIEEIVVTARKRQESLQETPISITAISADTMTEANMVDLRDIGKYTPGMTFTSYGIGNSEAGAMFLRGIGQADHLVATDPGVGLYIDGVYVGRNQGAALDLLDLQQVEVLRGPQGTLFGKNTIGGAVNVISHKPGGDAGGSLKLTAGNGGRLNGAVSVESALGNQGAFSLGLLSKVRDGVGEQIFTGTEIGDEDSLSGRAQLYFYNNDTEFSVAMDFARARQVAMPHSFYQSSLGTASCYTRDNTGYIPCAQGVEGNPFNSYSLDNLDSEQDLFGIAATVERDISNTLTFKSITAYRDMAYLGALEFDGAPQRIVYYAETGESDQLSQELQLSGIGNGGTTNWIVGLYYFTEDGNNDQHQDEFGALTNRLLEVETRSYAGFGQITSDLNDVLSLTAGLRYTKEAKDYDVFLLKLTSEGKPALTMSGEFDYAIRPHSLDNSWGALSGTLNLSYQLADAIMAYATYSRGFRSGGFTPRPNIPSSVLSYDPEYVNMYELGIKTLTLNERLRLNVSIYRNDYEDYQAQVNQAGVRFSTRVLNAAEAEINGAEVELTLLLSPMFRIDATYAYTDASIQKVELDAGITANFSKGHVLPYVSKYTYSLSPQLEFSLESGSSLLARLDYSYRDDFYGQISNSPFEKEAGYGLLNLRVQYKNPNQNWTLALYGINLADKEYTRVRNYFPDFTGFAIWNTDRREYGLEASYEF
ncbi:MAG: TonB-dependent receptor [Pseudohongiellaceae bacterium]